MEQRRITRENTENIRQVLDSEAPTQKELERLRTFLVDRLNERWPDKAHPDTLYGIALRLLEFGFRDGAVKAPKKVNTHRDPKLTQRQLHLLVLVAKGHRRFIDVNTCRADLTKLIEKGMLTDGWGELTDYGRLLLRRIEDGSA